jgi:hypothetical protein
MTDTSSITPEEVAANEAEQERAYEAEQEQEAAETHIPADEVALLLKEERRKEVWSKWSPQAVNLLALDTTQPVQWVPGADRIIRRGERQMWYAGEGQGKTQAAMHLIAQVCEAGGCVAYVDVENDEQEMAERLQPIVAAFDATDAVAERLLYMPGLRLPDCLKEPIADEFAKLLTTIDLFVIDSLTRVLGHFGYDEDSNQDVRDFMRDLPDVLKACGIATLILDNTGHDESRARGARAKTALIETAYKITGGKGVKPNQHGTLSLKLERSRSGQVAGWITAGSGNGDFSRLTAQEGKAPKAGAGEKMVERRKAIAKLLADQPDRRFTTQELQDEFGVSVNTIKQDLSELVASGQVDGQPGGFWLCRR